MKNSIIVKCAVMGAILPLFVGCVERQVVYRDRPAPPPPAVVVNPPPPGPVVVEGQEPPPPPPQVEIQTAPPGPMTAYFWAPGVWEWRGRWVWTRGHWILRPRPGAVWYGPHWGYRHNHHVWIAGEWR